MSYISKNLLAGEEIIFRTRKHMIIFFQPLFCTVVAYLVTPYMQANSILANFIIAPWIIAALLWFAILIEYLSSDFAVTNKRIMMREGFFTRHTNETRLTAISQVNVDQSLLAQLCNYGQISINAFGAFDVFSLIANPYQFQKTVNEQMDKRENLRT